jgi:hypothetical protein
MKHVSCIIGAALVAATVGCSSQEKVDFKSIAARPAPEMQSMADRPVDMDRHYAYMRNTNYRAFWDDLRRMFYVDNPSRLTPFPSIDTSGQPR